MFKCDIAERETFFNRLDFRTKFVMIITVTLIAFIGESPVAEGIFALLVSSACLLVGVRLEYLKLILKVMLPFYMFLLITMGC